ncbi:MAG: hypothetical protein AMJ79_00095 [Phycisphaerae bacterium SM23_30]|nr:MAG: hypothetical protein AMJ79_00095 [Phycisphaerae bacterium SM23_30]
MTKSRKIYVGILITAISALIFDKAVLRPSVSEPQTTLARPAQSPTPDTNVAPPVEKPLDQQFPFPVSPVLSATTSLSAETTSGTANNSTLSLKEAVHKVLHAIGSGLAPPEVPHETRDLFAASDEFLSALRNNSPLQDDQKAPPIPTMTLHLTGILIGPENRCAVINNEVLFCGQNIGPYQVLEIYPDQVILAIQSERITLFLDK